METEGLFRLFAAGSMERAGALVDDLYPDGLAVCLPAGLQREWRTDDLISLGFGARLPPGAQRVTLEADWLGRFVSLLGGAGERLRIVLAAPNPAPGGLTDKLARELVLDNGVYRADPTAEPAWTRYLIISFLCTAISDEKRELLIPFGVNLSQGSLISGYVDELSDLAVSSADPAVVRPASGMLPPDWAPARLDELVRRTLPEMIALRLAAFLGGMQRRLDRDLARVFDYYDGLRRQSQRRRRRNVADKAVESLRIEAAQREYEAKVADLRQKYDLRVEIKVSQVLEVVMPVRRIGVILKRRKKERRISLDWNPLTKHLDTLPLDWGWSAEARRVLCDDALHLVAPAGLAPCADCGREYCRACHPKQCPRCRAARNR